MIFVGVINSLLNLEGKDVCGSENYVQRYGRTSNMFLILMGIDWIIVG